MDTRAIETLLEKYYDGETTLAEEEILRKFFSSEDIPDALLSHKALFMYNTAAGRGNLCNPDFEEDINIRLHSIPPGGKIMGFIPSGRFFLISSVAAGILLLVGLIFVLKNNVLQNNQAGYSYSEQVQAYNQAQKALLLVSANLNTGLQQVEHLCSIEKAFNNIKLLNKFYEYQTIIINPDDFSQISTKPQ